MAAAFSVLTMLIILLTKKRGNKYYFLACFVKILYFCKTNY